MVEGVPELPSHGKIYSEREGEVNGARKKPTHISILMHSEHRVKNMLRTENCDPTKPLSPNQCRQTNSAAKNNSSHGKCTVDSPVRKTAAKRKKCTDPDENIRTTKFRRPESESLAEKNVIVPNCQNSQVSSTPLRNHGIHIQDSRERVCKLSVSVKGVPITDMKSFLAQKKMEREKKFKSKVPVPGAPLPKGKKKN